MDEPQRDPANASDTEEQLRQISHDLRNNLYVIQQGLELLRAYREKPDEFESTCDLVTKEHSEACRHVEQLIHLARQRPG